MKKIVILIFVFLLASCGIEIQELPEAYNYSARSAEFILNTVEIKTFESGKGFKNNVTMEKTIVNENGNGEEADIILTVSIFNTAFEDICGKSGTGIFYNEEIEFTNGNRECELGADKNTLETEKITVGAYMERVKFNSKYDFGDNKKVPVNCIFYSTKYSCITNSEKGGIGCFTAKFEGGCKEITN